MAHEHWTSYWKTGVTDSFGAQEPQWYKVFIKPFWQEIFNTLPPQARILDVATGNGAVAKIALQTSNETNKKFIIVASDKSKQDTSIPSFAESEKKFSDKIQYLMDTPIETLKIPDQEFDLISSQFGIEYSDIKRALTTLKNSLKPTGELVFIIHNSNSIICNQSKLELKQYREIIDLQPIFKKLNSLIVSMGHIRSRSDLERLKSNNKAISDREAFNQLVAKITTKYPQGIVIADFLNQLKPLFKEMMMTPMANKLQFSNTLKQQFLQARKRLLDMISASMNEKDMKKFLVLAEKTGFDCSLATSLADENNNLLAWQVRFKLHDRA